MKKFFYVLSLFGVFFIFSTPVLAACSWVAETTTYTYSTPGGTPSTSVTGGCSAKKLFKSNEGKCTATKPSYAPSSGSEAVCCCDSDSAASTAFEPPLFTPPDLQIAIPGMKTLSKINCLPGAGGAYFCEIPWLGEYVVGIYNYALSIAGILAAIMLMAGGVLWLISAGDASKITQAKELIIGAITGLIILAASFIILMQINPNLVNLKNISVSYIPKIELIANGSDSDNNLSSGACAGDSGLSNITNVVALSNVSDPRLTQNAADGLKIAINVAKTKNVKLLVTSANRTYDVQKRLWDSELKKQGGDEAKARKYVAPPSQCQGTCYGHCAGVAIDVCLYGTASCSRIGGAGNANYTDADVAKLQTIMKEAGWKRYCGEWWHFQYGLAPKQSCSP